MAVDLSNYVDVPERIRAFREKFPDGCLQQVRYEVIEVGGKTFVAYTAAAYRTPDDERPGMGTAWEPFPGPTPYTRDSELMNAETSAWGRAIIAVGAADASRVASAEEVRNRSGFGVAAAGDRPTSTAKPVAKPMPAEDSSPPAGTDAPEYTFTFGKHKGEHIETVPKAYLQWLLKQPAKEGYEEQHKQSHSIYRAELHARGVEA